MPTNNMLFKQSWNLLYCHLGNIINTSIILFSGIYVNDLPDFAAGWQTLYKVEHIHPHKGTTSFPSLYSAQDHSLIQFALSKMNKSEHHKK